MLFLLTIIILYFSLIVISLRFSRIIAKKCIASNCSLEVIKRVVWNFLNSFILTLSIIVLLSILFYFELVSEFVYTVFLAIGIFLLLVNFFYLFKKVTRWK